jgi:hypothetical protein
VDAGLAGVLFEECLTDFEVVGLRHEMSWVEDE